MADDASIHDLCLKITEVTNLLIFDLKAGFPPHKLDLNGWPSDTRLSKIGIKLNGEQIIVDGKELSDASHLEATQDAEQHQSRSKHKSAPSSSQGLLSLARKSKSKIENDPPTIPVSLRGGQMVLRVMPDDNSCLFRALSTCLLGNGVDGMTELRSIVAQAIQADPTTYSEAILQQARDKYCAWIQREDSWGGYVDIKAIAESFGTEVVGIDVQSGLITKYCEGAALRCFVVYSGIHYDALAFVPDGLDSMHEMEFDQKQFDSSDHVFLEAAIEVGRVLKARKYFTNTASFTVRCGDCGWSGQGEKMASDHAKKTGHMSFSEG